MVTFYILDVFAKEKFAGNQLAVVSDARNLTNREMQQIAKEMNFSETTFILTDTEYKGSFDVRIFTPEEEVPFAGHPTLGTAYVIAQELLAEKVDEIILTLKIGKIKVKFNWDNPEKPHLWMQQKSPFFGQIFDSDRISKVLGIEKKDIDEKFPIQEVSTGLPFILVPLKHLEDVKKAAISLDEYTLMMGDIEAKAILIFCPQTYHDDNDLNVRMFAPYYGVPEDPATGSANGCLAAYLVKYRYFGDDNIDAKVEQGYEIGRPSLLFLKSDEMEGEIRVFVGGCVFMVAKGEFL